MDVVSDHPSMAADSPIVEVGLVEADLAAVLAEVVLDVEIDLEGVEEGIVV